MKTCNICSQEKPETEFDVRNKVKGTRRAYCKVCRKAKRKEILNRRKSLSDKDLGRAALPRRPKSLGRKDLYQLQISSMTFPFFSSRSQHNTGVPPYPSGQPPRLIR